ncbi:MAG TPA: menaquinone reductase multiheme cytochrome c subunit QrcA [Bryobacteraceae bacterium]|nr:menaquinone reductase multiheme cytochrome c subunit QrcA [Bryobacteraceae bacterium]
MKSNGRIWFPAGVLVSLGLGWFGFPAMLYRAEPQPVAFSHKAHTGQKGGMKCEDCHALREDGSFSGIPGIEKCAGCHASAIGSTAAEKRLVDEYVSQNREIPWLVYARQPENVWFSHAAHIKLGKLTCEQCHGEHGKTDTLRPYEEDRISGYSRDVRGNPGGKKMKTCEDCHGRCGVGQQGCLDCHK